MGTYLSASEVVTRIGTTQAAQLTADSGTTPDTTKIGLMIDEVEGVVHGYLSKRITIPVVQADYGETFKAVVGVVMRMTVFQLHALRPPVADAIKSNNESALQWLKDVAAGTIDLPDDSLNTDRAEWGSEDPTEASHETMS